jgi:hypothetical protein
VDAVSDKAAKDDYDSAIYRVKQRASKGEKPTPKQEQIISNYENIMEDEEERLAQEARAMEKAEKDLYEATKAKKYFDGLTTAEKKIISDYDARAKETPEQREEREASEAEEDLKTVELEDRRIFHETMLDNVRYWSRIFGLDGKVLNNLQLLQTTSRFFSPQPQMGEAEIVGEKESDDEVKNRNILMKLLLNFYLL